MEIASYLSFSGQNFEVAPRFLEKLVHVCPKESSLCKSDVSNLSVCYSGRSRNADTTPGNSNAHTFPKEFLDK